MPTPSKVLAMPKALQEALNARLIESGFARYDELAQWLNNELRERGLELRFSRSSIHRHAQKFNRKLDVLKRATEQAKVLVESTGDAEGAMHEALLKMAQNENYQLLYDLSDLPLEPTDRVNMLAKINAGIARIVQASVQSKRWQAEIRQQVAQQAESEAQKQGISKDTAAAIRAAIEGAK